MTSFRTAESPFKSDSTASNMSCDRDTAVARAIVSRENSDSSMPPRPWVTPSPMAGTPPATCAVAPSARACRRMNSGCPS